MRMSSTLRRTLSSSLKQPTRLLVASQLPQLNTHFTRKEETKSFLGTIIGRIAAVGVLGTLALNNYDSPSCSELSNGSPANNFNKGNAEGLTLNEVREFLKSSLTDIRARNPHAPLIQLEYKPDSKYFRASYPIPSRADWISIVSAFTTTYHEECNSDPIQINSNSKNNSEPTNHTMTLLLPGGNSSVLIESSTNYSTSNSSRTFPSINTSMFHFYKDSEFTKNELKAFVSSYSSAVQSSTQQKRSDDGPRIIFRTSPKRGSNGDEKGEGDLFNIIGGLPLDRLIRGFQINSFDRNDDGDDDDDDEGLVQKQRRSGGDDDANEFGGSANRNKISTSQAIKMLEKLGMEVFHPENGEAVMDWDSLAG
jgi:hypothetical protein